VKQHAAAADDDDDGFILSLEENTIGPLLNGLGFSGTSY
jgi:hypothetical protein